jgi:membrane fusion protein, multidrug efflux system
VTGPPVHPVPSEAAAENAPEPRPVPGRRIGWGIAILGALVALALVIGTVPRVLTRRALAEEASADSVPVVTVTHVHRAQATSDLALPGTLEPVHQAAIYARTSGFVTRWGADIGRPVHAGDLLATIEVPDLDAQLLEAKATVAQARTALEFAKVERDRWERMTHDSVVTKEEYDQKAEIEVAAEAALAAAQATVARYASLQGYERVVAPFGGVITARNVDVGAFVQATGGMTTSLPSNTGGAPTSLFQLAQTDTVRVYVTVPEVYSTSIRPGEAAAISVTELPDRIFMGQVVRTARAIDPQSRTLLTEVRVLNPTGILLPGMYASVRFVFDRASPPLIVPATALLPLTDGIRVASIDRDSRVHTHKIDIVRDFGAYVEVDGGVEDGETLITNPSATLADGTRVRAVGAVAPADSARGRTVEAAAPR